MNKTVKILSALLAVVMLLSSLVISTGAIPLLNSEGEKLDSSGNVTGIVDYELTLDTYLTGEYNTDIGYVAPQTPQEKLATMELMWEDEKNGYQFWVEKFTGEVATVKIATGEILFSNPWNVSTSMNTNDKEVDLSVKKELLSQLVVNYVDNNNAKTMYSCTDAASRGQINVEYIKNGIRVEYSIGRQETRMLVPMQINAERFETKILKVMRETIDVEFPIMISDGKLTDENGKIIPKNNDKWPKAEVGKEYGLYELIKEHYPDFNYDDPCDPASNDPIVAERSQKENYYLKKLTSFYQLQDPEKAQTDSEKSAIEAAFPITKKMPIYVLSPSISNRDKAALENYIKSYVVSYTYEDLDYDHELVGYVASDRSPPLFKLALEYSVDELGGISVRLPANGIRFDESVYQLTSVEMLPYMGAGENDGDDTDGSDGYTFFPDGSGALFGFDEINTVSGKVYGQDYAYHQITGTNQEAIRYPVFGIVENWEGKKTEKTLVSEAVYDPDTGALIKDAVYSSKVVNAEEDKGFVAIIEEGDALAELTCNQGETKHRYNTVKMVFYPRPKDSYNMADAISVGSNTVMTVVSKRKYVGSYKIRYIMLSDDDLAFDSGLTSYYECSWMGMALAYRDYLEKTGVLSRLDSNDVDDDIPLYIETFGTLMTTEKFMSIPVDVMTPLTTFGDVVTMYNELSADIVSSMKNVVANGQAIGISDTSAKEFSNVNFKLTGYANGGMYSTVPYHLNWEAAVGGAKGFEELVALSKDEEKGGFGIFPDFDFLYINATEGFDGVSLDRDAVKTIDNRYTSRREYSATYQTYVGYFQYAITPSSFDRLVTKLTKNYLKYNPTGISLSTLGTDLNSDFNEDEPLNREDSKAYAIEALNKIAALKNDDGNNLGIMVDGGNAYTWKYIDYIVNMPLNSSRYNNAINAVPFMGVVLHGFVQFAGTPINEEGDLESAMLKAIENGASIYFTLSYQNTQKLKDDVLLSSYYSVRYDIWKEDLVDMYVELNNLLADLQTKLIIDHEFLTGERAPDPDEELADKEALEKAEEELKAIEELKALKAALKAALNLRHTPNKSIASIEAALEEINIRADRIATQIGNIDEKFISDCADIINHLATLDAAVEDAKKYTYKTAVYEDVIEATDKFITDAILSGGALVDVQSVYDAAAKGITDENKLADIRKVVDCVQRELLIAAIDAAVEASFQLVKDEDENDVSYDSTILENAAIAVMAKDVIAAVNDATKNKFDSLKASAADSDKTLVDNVGKAVSKAIKDTFTAEFAFNTVITARTAYTTSGENINKLITDYIKKATERQSAVDAAIAAGLTKEEVEAAVLLQAAVTETSNKVSSLKAYETAYKTALSAYLDRGKAFDTYYNELDKAIAVYESDSALQKSMKVISAYERAKAEYDVYKLISDIDGRSLDSLKASLDEKLAAVDALANKDAAQARYDALIAEMTVGVNDTAVYYNKLDKATKAYFDAVDAIYASASTTDEVKNGLFIRNNIERLKAIQANARCYIIGNTDYIAATKALNEATAALAAAEAEYKQIDASVKTQGDKVIGTLKTSLNKLSKEEFSDGQIILTAIGRNIFMDAANDVFVASLTGYKEYFDNITAAEEASKAAAAALKVKTDENKELINAVVTADAAVAAEASKLVAGEVKLDKIVQAYAVKYDYVEGKLRDTASYADSVQVIYNAYLQAQDQLKVAQKAYDNAVAAIEGLEDRRDLMKELAEKAHTEFRVYAIAYLASNFTIEQLEKLADRIDSDEFEGKPKPEYLLEIKEADYFANAIKVASTELTELEAAYNNATDNAKAEAKVLFDAAVIVSEKEADDIVKLYVNVLNNCKSAGIDADNAQNFLDTAISETATAKEKLDICAQAVKDLEKNFTAKIRDLKVALIGEGNISANKILANTYLKNINDYLDGLKVSLATVVADWAEIDAITEAVKIVKVEFDELYLRRYDLTVEERARYDELNGILNGYEARLNEINADLLEQVKIFQDSFKYVNTTIPYFADAIAIIDSDLENAKMLLDILTAEGKDTTEVAATVERFKAVSDELHSKYDAMFDTYLEICGVAEEYGVVSKDEETDKFYTVVSSYTKAKQFINELFGKITVEEEKEVTKYTCDDGSIVAVTYGGKDGKDHKAYRTFLLNYNAFAVTVVYNGVTYKLDGYEYRVINH